VLAHQLAIPGNAGFQAGLWLAYSQLMRPPQQKPVMAACCIAAMQAGPGQCGIQILHHLRSATLLTIVLMMVVMSLASAGLPWRK
jgi:hypothetical protein